MSAVQYDPFLVARKPTLSMSPRLKHTNCCDCSKLFSFVADDTAKPAGIVNAGSVDGQGLQAHSLGTQQVAAQDLVRGSATQVHCV